MVTITVGKEQGGVLGQTSAGRNRSGEDPIPFQ